MRSDKLDIGSRVYAGRTWNPHLGVVMSRNIETSGFRERYSVGPGLWPSDIGLAW